MNHLKYEKVHTITDWYDGAREGIADLNGKPHYYKNHWDIALEDWSEVYLLEPLDAKTFALAIEDWQIWLRWEAAFKQGQTTQATHPALPEDQPHHNELKEILSQRLVINPNHHVRAKGDFKYGEQSFVEWSVID